jgi:tRNA(Ile2) C34 agmatinyltransferase TiaS
MNCPICRNEMKQEGKEKYYCRNCDIMVFERWYGYTTANSSKIIRMR